MKPTCISGYQLPQAHMNTDQRDCSYNKIYQTDQDQSQLNPHKFLPSKSQQSITTKNKNNQLTSSLFKQKFKWKLIPQNIQLKKQTTLKQYNNNLSSLSLQKNNLYQTNVTFNGFISIQNSKFKQDQIHDYSNLLLAQKNQHNLEQKITKQISLLSISKYCKENNEEIQEVESLTHSQNTPDIDKQQTENIVLEESFIQWTYETGFKNYSQEQIQVQDL